jgi:hypothetical protein
MFRVNKMLTLLTNSAESAFWKCPRFYALSYRLGIRPIHTADPLRQGSACHLGWELLKNGSTPLQAEYELHQVYRETPCPPWLSTEEYATERETSIAMVRGWHWRWIGAGRHEGDAVLKRIAVELPFNLPIINPLTGFASRTYRNAGKVDGIVEVGDGRMMVEEEKTVGESIEPDAPYWLTLQMDGQISRYFLAARKQGYPVQGIIYSATRKPAISPRKLTKAEQAQAQSTGYYCGRPMRNPPVCQACNESMLYAAADAGGPEYWVCGKTDCGILPVEEGERFPCPERETPTMFGARLLADMMMRPDFYFCRMEVPRLQTDIEEFRAEMWVTALTIHGCELLESKYGLAAWPRRTRECNRMGTCCYLSVCKGLKADPTEEIPAGFERVECVHSELPANIEELANDNDNSTTAAIAAK